MTYTYTVRMLGTALLALAFLASQFVLVTPAFAATSYATSVASSAQGLKKNGAAVDAARSNTANALNAPDGVFYSLGYGGEIVLGFAQEMYGNLALTVIETTNGAYPVETADVWVSENAAGPWTSVGSANNDGGTGDARTTFNFDQCFQYVRIKDTTNSALHDATSDGFDLNAVESNYTGDCPPPEPDPDPVTPSCPVFDKAYESDLETEVVGDAPALVGFIHPAWTATIPGASWIWKAGATANDEVVAFEETINAFDGVVTASLQVASDNSYEVFIDGVEVAADANGDNFTLASQDTHNLLGDINPGVHTLRIEVKNFGAYEAQSNPAGLMYRLDMEVEKCLPEDDEVKNSNKAVVINKTEANASTGGNYAGGSTGGDGGNGGDIENEGGDQDVDGATTGAGGRGGNGGVGGTVRTGDATAEASTVNVINSNTTRINRCGCDGNGGSGDVEVKNKNKVVLINKTEANAKTGKNRAGGSRGGNGGNGGDIENEGGDVLEVVVLEGNDDEEGQEVDDSTTGNGGAGGNGSDGGLIETGTAVSGAGTVNVVNTNRTRIRR